MPKFISASRLAFFTSLETAAQTIAGADVNLEECASVEDIQAAITPSAPDEQAIGNAACDALLASADITVAEDQSHEDALAAFAGQIATAEASEQMLTEAVVAAGLTLPEAAEGEALTAEAITEHLKGQLKEQAIKKSISTVAAAGAPIDQAPETDENGSEPKADSEHLAHYQTLKGTARTEYFAENKSAILNAQNG